MANWRAECRDPEQRAADRPRRTARCCPCSSCRVGRPASALLWGRVAAGGMTVGGCSELRSSGLRAGPVVVRNVAETRAGHSGRCSLMLGGAIGGSFDPTAMAAMVGGRAGLSAVGPGHARRGRGPLVRPPAKPGLPAPPPGGLAAARAWAVGDGVRGGRRVRPLRAGGPTRSASRRPLGGHLQPGDPLSWVPLCRLGAAAHPQRVAALAPLALVGVAGSGRTGPLPAGADGRARTGHRALRLAH
jgi:hypothetical protein